MHEPAAECAEYIKEKPGTKRIMEGIRAKYVSLGTASGNIVIMNPSKDEKAFLRGLFKKDYTENKSITIGLRKFEKAFIHTKFEGVLLEGLLEAYYGKTFLTKSEFYRQKKDEEADFFENIMEQSFHSLFVQWLTFSLKGKTRGIYKMIMRLYHEDPLRLKEILNNLEKAAVEMESLESKMLLPVFAAKITQDPHGMDENTELFRLLLYFLAWRFELDLPRTGEEKAALLYRAGIISDTGNRVIMTYGLKAFDNEFCPKGWQLFSARHEILTLNLTNLKDVEKLEPYSEKSRFIYCFENPSVFYAVTKELSWIAAVCTSGQINLAAYILMDLLVRNNYKLSYCGDFDPEGLLIADKLKIRYEQSIKFIGYTKESYIKSISNKSLSPNRIKQLERLANSDFAEVAQEILSNKKAGYQEHIIDEITKIIKEQEK